jgi:PTS hybrid protein
VSNRVGLVLVSHSAGLAAGLAELAGQMAPDVPIRPAGGLPDGGLGTDFAAVSAALAQAEQGAGVLLLYDLGSARMTAELAVETLADPESALLVDAPLVEGAVAAAVAAQGGADLAAVAAAARHAAESGSPAPPDPGAAPDGQADSGAADQSAGPAVSAEVELVNDVGLHARPAAQLARTVAGLDARVRLGHNGRDADAASVLDLLALGARRGDRLTVRATGRQADEAVRRVRDLVAGGFAD